MIQLLNFLHRMKMYRLLELICTIGYRLKGKNVRSKYHPEFRAYEYQVENRTYLSVGAGWAYGYGYLYRMLKDTYNHYYMPKSDDIVVDIGAGLGEETVIYSQLVGPGGKVFSFEANPVTYGGLKYMVGLNNFTWTTPVNAAIYKNDGQVFIEDDSENYLINTVHDKDEKGIKVTAVSLDSFVRKNNINRIDFLKSNIEGAEQFLVEGMQESARLVKNMCISCHDFRHVYHQHGEFYMTKSKVLSFLKQHGFEIQTRSTGNRVTDDYIYAQNPNLK